MPTPIASNPLRTPAAAIVAVAALALAGALALPELAEAALRNAAGGGGGGGFASLTRYLDRLASLLIPVGGVGLIAGGFMFMGGNPRAARVLGYVAVGVVIVLGSKGLAA